LFSVPFSKLFAGFCNTEMRLVSGRGHVDDTDDGDVDRRA